MTKPGELIVVGRLGRPRGVRGDIYINSSADSPKNLLTLKSLSVKTVDGWRQMTVTSCKIIGGRPVIKFEGVDNREDAANWTGKELAVPYERLAVLPEGEHYIFDLIGCDVVTVDDNRRLGRLKEVINYPANDVYLIVDDDDNEILFPAVSDFVCEIDIAGKKIVVRKAGLLTADENGL